MTDFIPGEGPLLVSMPHVGVEIPEDIAARLTPLAGALPDTDWHVDRLYDFLAGLDVPVLKARQSRYVVDLNRPPDGTALYPGQAGTGLVPVETFAGEALYAAGETPDAAEIETRVEKYWRPYHEKLTGELARIRAVHGFAILWDAHSIRSQVPRLFEGQLPDLNFGTSGETSAAPGLAAALMRIAGGQGDYSAVLNARFTGGYITRQYGDPAAGVHALQLELSQATYMDEDPPYAFDEARAARIRPLLRRLVEAARSVVPGS
jgi:N-formylglutamate deformylase